MINTILGSSNIFELKDNLANFIANETLSQKDYRKLYEEIENLCVRISMFNECKAEKWSYTSGRNAVFQYLLENWNFQKRAILNKQEIQKIILEIKEVFLPCENYVWDPNLMQNIMNFLESKYNFNYSVLNDNYLNIIALNCKHKDVNAFARSYITNSNKAFADIYLTSPHDYCKDTQAEILLHELGHIVNIYLTGDANIVPDIFIELFEDDFDDIDNELFANCFAITVLANEEMKNYCNTIFKESDLRQKLNAYFKLVLNPAFLRKVNEVFYEQ